MANKFPPLYTDDQMEEFGRRATALQSRIKRQEPIKISMTGRKRIPKASERRTIAPSNKIAETRATEPKGVSRYAQTRDLAGQTFTGSPLRQRIKDNMARMGATRGLNADSDPFGPAPINRNVLQGFGYGSDPETIRFNRFLQSRSMAESPEEKTAISGAFFRTKGLGEETLENKGVAIGEGIRARAAENIARIRAGADVEAAGLRTGTGTTVPYQGIKVSGESGDEIRVLDRRTGEFRGEGLTQLSDEMKARIDKIKSSDQFDEWYRSQDPNTRSMIRQYLGK